MSDSVSRRIGARAGIRVRVKSRARKLKKQQELNDDLVIPARELGGFGRFYATHRLCAMAVRENFKIINKDSSSFLKNPWKNLWDCFICGVSYIGGLALGPWVIKYSEEDGGYVFINQDVMPRSYRQLATKVDNMFRSKNRLKDLSNDEIRGLRDEFNRRIRGKQRGLGEFAGFGNAGDEYMEMGFYSVRLGENISAARYFRRAAENYDQAMGLGLDREELEKNMERCDRYAELCLKKVRKRIGWSMINNPGSMEVYSYGDFADSL